MAVTADVCDMIEFMDNYRKMVNGDINVRINLRFVGAYSRIMVFECKDCEEIPENILFVAVDYMRYDHDTNTIEFILADL